MQQTQQKQLKIFNAVNTSIFNAIENGENILVKTPRKVDLLNGYIQDPRNYFTNKVYQGVNKAILPSGYYASFNQVKQSGGSVKKGAKSYLIYACYTHEFFKCKLVDADGNETFKVYTREQYEKLEDPKPEIVQNWKTFHHSYYRVFNINDCENLPKLNWETIPTLPSPKIPDKELDKFAEGIITLNTQDKSNSIGIQYDSDVQSSCYNVVKDKVYIKNFFDYADSSEYYENVFHELAHATGHSTRLNREGITSIDSTFGSDTYSIEELIAETTSIYCLRTLGLLTYKILDNAKAYIKSWYEHLKDPLTKDPGLLIKVFSQADKAYNYLFSLEEE